MNIEMISSNTRRVETEKQILLQRRIDGEWVTVHKQWRSRRPLPQGVTLVNM